MSGLTVGILGASSTQTTVDVGGVRIRFPVDSPIGAAAKEKAKGVSQQAFSSSQSVSSVSESKAKSIGILGASETQVIVNVGNQSIGFPVDSPMGAAAYAAQKKIKKGL